MYEGTGGYCMGEKIKIREKGVLEDVRTEMPGDNG